MQADITDEAAMLAAMDGIDAVIHLAGEPRGLPEIGVATFRDNALGTFVAIDTAQRAGRRAVLLRVEHQRLRHLPLAPQRPAGQLPQAAPGRGRSTPSRRTPTA